MQECKDIFATPQQRRNHCIEIHKYPSDFRFDAFNKGKSKKNKTTQLHNKGNAKFSNGYILKKLIL